ncbi:(Lyso)-N-acylphosphatidylethanolamine lipase-like isoform X2 [Homarus americanus]|uniref:(Lyso)-N-acylphosphatidylethanolamine lipase-like isoform X2 n=1 Tax=Homarus americanus TaxID=6706 RepID=UPI001C456F3D|nr:(Lyso)-N-acylphosphatidylethanolamine lipase-like isoform X2 [Homarus americanus]
MTEEIGFELERQQESWFGSWLRWCPTSLSLLREAEKAVLSNLKGSYRGHYVNVGCAIDKTESHIWTVSFNEESDNVPLVLLHGFGSGVGLWCLNFDSLSASRPVYAIDIIGFGRSSRPTFTKDPLEAEREFITSIELWRQKLALEQFILVGHSFGGFLAASYAIKHPERIRHLILADPWGFPERPLDVAERYKFPFWVKAVGAILQPFNPLFVVRTAGPWGPKLLQKARPDLIRKFSGMVKDAEEVIPSYLYHCNAQNPSGESAFHTLMAGFGWAKYPMIQRMDSLRKGMPMTLIYGSRSWVDRDPGFQIKYMRNDSYVNVQVIPGAGHHVYADKAEIFNNLINNIGKHVDDGTLPALAPDLPTENTEENQDDVGMSFSKIINVRNDNLRDETTVQVDMNVSAEELD